MSAKVCLCAGYKDTAVVCATCGLPSAGAVVVKHESEAKDLKADAKAAPAAGAAAAAAAGRGAADVDIAMALAPVELSQEQRSVLDAVAAVHNDDMAYGRMATTMANVNDPQSQAALHASMQQTRQLMQLLQWRADLLALVAQLQNCVKRVYYRGVNSTERLVLLPVMATAAGDEIVAENEVTVRHFPNSKHLIVCTASTDPMSHIAANGSTGAGWTRVDAVKIEMAADTDRPTVPVGLRFVLGGQYHLHYGGLSLELCRNLPRTVAMAVTKPEPAAAAVGGAVVVTME